MQIDKTIIGKQIEALRKECGVSTYRPAKNIRVFTPLRKKFN